MDISSVSELTGYDFSNNQLVLGANITLTKAMSIFDSLSTKNGFQYLEQMRYHIDLVAHIPVRNVSQRINLLSSNILTTSTYFSLWMTRNSFIDILSFLAVVLRILYRKEE